LKLLTELNKKQNITMVMVTHDVGLKSFADRIIWMRDGKIQRIETVPAEKKIDAIKRNEQELQELREKKTRDSKATAAVEYRVPTDYHTHISNMKRKVLDQRAD